MFSVTPVDPDTFPNQCKSHYQLNFGSKHIFMMHEILVTNYVVDFFLCVAGRFCKIELNDSLQFIFWFRVWIKRINTIFSTNAFIYINNESTSFPTGPQRFF